MAGQEITIAGSGVVDGEQRELRLVRVGKSIKRHEPCLGGDAHLSCRRSFGEINAHSGSQPPLRLGLAGSSPRVTIFPECARRFSRERSWRLFGAGGYETAGLVEWVAAAGYGTADPI